MRPDDPAGAGEALESLYELRGHPIRIHVLSGAVRDQALGRLAGFLTRVSATELELQLSGPFLADWNDAILVVEVLTPRNLVRFETRAVPVAQATYRLGVRVPELLLDVQRRKHHRTDVALPITYLRGGLGPPVGGELANLGAGGAAFWTEDPFGPGDRLVLQFDSPDGTRFADLWSECVRANPHPDGRWLVAVQFRDLHPAVESALAAYVAAAAAEPAPGKRGRVFRL